MTQVTVTTDRSAQASEMLNRQFARIGSIVSVRGEVDACFTVMKGFFQSDPDEVMRLVSGLTARLVEIQVMICRLEDVHPQWKPVRVREVEPAIEELGRQYQIASRRHAIAEFEYTLTTGARL